MAEPPAASLFPYADHVLDRISAHAAVAGELRRLAGRSLVLDFHGHGPEPGWCASIVVEGGAGELVHLRCIVKTREECAPMGRVLAALLASRFGLPVLPAVVVDGVPHPP